MFPSMRHVYKQCSYNVSFNGCLLVRKEMAERNDRAIVVSFEVMDHVTGQANQVLQNQNGMASEFRGLGKFQRNNQLTFKGRYDLDGAQVWF